MVEWSRPADHLFPPEDSQRPVYLEGRSAQGRPQGVCVQVGGWEQEADKAGRTVDFVQIL